MFMEYFVCFNINIYMDNTCISVFYVGPWILNNNVQD